MGSPSTEPPYPDESAVRLQADDAEREYAYWVKAAEAGGRFTTEDAVALLQAQGRLVDTLLKEQAVKVTTALARHKYRELIGKDTLTSVDKRPAWLPPNRALPSGEPLNEFQQLERDLSALTLAHRPEARAVADEYRMRGMEPPGFYTLMYEDPGAPELSPPEEVLLDTWSAQAADKLLIQEMELRFVDKDEVAAAEVAAQRRALNDDRTADDPLDVVRNHFNRSAEGSTLTAEAEEAGPQKVVEQASAVDGVSEVEPGSVASSQEPDQSASTSAAGGDAPRRGDDEDGPPAQRAGAPGDPPRPTGSGGIAASSESHDEAGSADPALNGGADLTAESHDRETPEGPDDQQAPQRPTPGPLRDPADQLTAAPPPRLPPPPPPAAVTPRPSEHADSREGNSTLGRRRVGVGAVPDPAAASESGDRARSPHEVVGAPSDGSADAVDAIPGTAQSPVADAYQRRREQLGEGAEASTASGPSTTEGPDGERPSARATEPPKGRVVTDAERLGDKEVARPAGQAELAP